MTECVSIKKSGIVWKLSGLGVGKPYKDSLKIKFCVQRGIECKNCMNPKWTIEINEK